jgi:hypothetical protein
MTGALVAVVGCGGTKTPRTSSPSGGGLRGTTLAKDPPQPLNTPGGITTNTRVRLVSQRLGTVPYDNFSLPIVSPDLRFVATETGATPDWATVLARPSGSVPAGTAIEIYTLGNETTAPALVNAVTTPALLGRSCDAQGFLVEAPQNDGSRWIGSASWETGAVSWLVRDDRVNAFAAAGPNGALAWSRRDTGNRFFDLVVRRDGVEFVLPADGGDWLMPTWAGSNAGLFVLRLVDGRLEALHLIALTQASLEQTTRRITLATELASRSTGYQAMANQYQVTGQPMSSGERLVFWHPSQARMAVWRPLTSDGPALQFLAPDSFSATDDGLGAMIVTTGRDGLILQSVQNPALHADIIDGTFVARRTTRADWPHVLLDARDANRIGLVAIKLLPRE